MFARVIAAGLHLSRLSVDTTFALLFPSTPYGDIIGGEREYVKREMQEKLKKEREER